MFIGPQSGGILEHKPGKDFTDQLEFNSLILRMENWRQTGVKWFSQHYILNQK